jgi:hypothetical protein
VSWVEAPDRTEIGLITQCELVIAVINEPVPVCAPLAAYSETRGHR